MDSSFVPRNNIEEAILLLIILLRKVALKRIQWDPSIFDHLCYALSISGGLRALACQVEELLPGIIDRKDMYHILALCYHAKGDDVDAMELWKKLLKLPDGSTYLPALLFSARICGESSDYVADGLSFARKAIKNSQGTCNWLMGVAYNMLGISLSTNSRSCINDAERVENQSEALNSLEIARRMTNMNDPAVVYRLCLENAEQRKLDAALCHAKSLVALEGGSNLRGWILLARILSAQKCFVDVETIVNVAPGQTGVWDQQELLRLKAKLQLAQGLLKETIETYSQLFAVLHIQRKSLGSGNNYKEIRKLMNDIEQETWHNLASIYMRLSQWHDAELCLSKSAGIGAFSASRLHTAGQLHEARGQLKEALRAYETALEVDPKHALGLVSEAVVLRRLGCQSPAIIRTLLTEALKLDRTDSSAWYNLGLLYKGNGTSSAMDAAECFQAAALLEETEPVEPFR